MKCVFFPLRRTKKKPHQQCQTGEAATSAARVRGPFTTPRRCSATASSSTKAAFSAVSTAGERGHLRSSAPATLERRSSKRERDVTDGGLSASSHWVIVSDRPGWAAAQASFLLKCHRGRSEDTSAAAKHTSLGIGSQRPPFLRAWGVGEGRSGVFHLLTVLSRKCHANDRQDRRLCTPRTLKKNAPFEARVRNSDAGRVASQLQTHPRSYSLTP